MRVDDGHAKVGKQGVHRPTPTPTGYRAQQDVAGFYVLVQDAACVQRCQCSRRRCQQGLGGRQGQRWRWAHTQGARVGAGVGVATCRRSRAVALAVATATAAIPQAGGSCGGLPVCARGGNDVRNVGGSAVGDDVGAAFVNEGAAQAGQAHGVVRLAVPTAAAEGSQLAQELNR